MIKNTVVANVKAGGSDQELRVILSEYERRLREMESDRNDSSQKLRQIIENLMREKDELAERLIKANHVKLQIINQEAAVALGAKDEVPSARLEDCRGETEPQTSFYLWGVGMIHSCQPIDEALQQRAPSGESLLEKKVYTSESIVKLDRTKDENLAL